MQQLCYLFSPLVNICTYSELMILVNWSVTQKRQLIQSNVAQNVNWLKCLHAKKCVLVWVELRWWKEPQDVYSKLWYFLEILSIILPFPLIQERYRRMGGRSHVNRYSKWSTRPQGTGINKYSDADCLISSLKFTDYTALWFEYNHGKSWKMILYSVVIYLLWLVMFWAKHYFMIVSP